MKRLVADQDTLTHSFDPNREPRLEVEPGESFTVETEDAFNGRLSDEHAVPTEEFMPELASRPGRLNPVTGPVYVKTAEPGDTLVVHIRRIEPSERGAIALMEDIGPQWEWRDWEFFDGPKRFTVEHHRGSSGRYEDGSLSVDGYEGPLAPLVGTIGVAPQYVTQSALWGQADHGGVWNHRYVAPGTTLYFPIYHLGGLLSLGDVHGAQGDCEFFGVADEVAGEVELACDVIKGKSIAYPRLETEDKLIQIYSYRPLEMGVRAATRLLMEWLVEDHGLSEKQAYWLVAVNPDFRIVIGNMIGFELMQYTVTAEISKRSLARAPRTDSDPARGAVRTSTAAKRSGSAFC